METARYDYLKNIFVTGHSALYSNHCGSHVHGLILTLTRLNALQHQSSPQNSRSIIVHESCQQEIGFEVRVVVGHSKIGTRRSEFCGSDPPDALVRADRAWCVRTFKRWTHRQNARTSESYTMSPDAIKPQCLRCGRTFTQSKLPQPRMPCWICTTDLIRIIPGSAREAVLLGSCAYF